MKKHSAILVIFIIGASLISCHNSKSNHQIDKEQIIEDSIKKVNLTRQQDSIDRERIFEALGDTVFRGVCFGMNRSQYQKAFNAFKKPLKKECDFDYFKLAGIKFREWGGTSIENNHVRSVEGYPYGLDDILKEKRLGTYFYNNKLFSVEWESERLVHDRYVVKSSLIRLITLFEKKYGKTNVNNTEDFNGSWDQLSEIARWETGKRRIIIYYRDLASSERDKWMEENYPSYYQYQLIVHFLDKMQKKEVDEYIKPILQKFEDDYRNKLKQDSINNANAL